MVFCLNVWSRQNWIWQIKKKTTKLATLVVVAIGLFLIFGTLTTSLAKSQENGSSALAGQRVLLLGDSQVAGAFGNAMSHEMTSHGASYFVRVGKVGWGVPRWWLNRNMAARLVRHHKPTLLLIELGGNDYNRPLRVDYLREVTNFWLFLIRTMEETHQVSGINWRIIWISPSTATGPAANLQHGRNRVAEIIRSVVTERNYVESRDITGTFGRTPDGLHFTFNGGRSWAEQVRRRIEVCLVH